MRTALSSASCLKEIVRAVPGCQQAARHAKNEHASERSRTSGRSFQFVPEKNECGAGVRGCLELSGTCKSMNLNETLPDNGRRRSNATMAAQTKSEQHGSTLDDESSISERAGLSAWTRSPITSLSGFVKAATLSVRGLASRKKPTQLYGLAMDQDLDIIAVQETKVESVDATKSLLQRFTGRYTASVSHAIGDWTLDEYVVDMPPAEDDDGEQRESPMLTPRNGLLRDSSSAALSWAFFEIHRNAASVASTFIYTTALGTSACWKVW
ncbi:hypothetical protein HPB51_015519 [Rhipicephalus microplus]|uniref:Uncharacterized protein n=1 Tax=Rhipicephalus microplus TaxID=6941 RepID=A0A9J6DGP7_RHIMP|nr:hypothetical protein HPB51_015519 [Rhipicephalus microplus]